MTTRRKRGNGEGTIFQRKDGRWVVSLSQGLAPLQKKRQVYFKTQKEAIAGLQKLRSQVVSGTLPSVSQITVAQFITRWLADIAKVRTRARTYESYESILRLHVVPTLGVIKLQQLSTPHIQRLLRQKQESGLSANTVRRIRDVLRNCLNDAARWELVGRNVAMQASTPRVAQQEMAIWTIDQARTFLDSIRDEPLGAAFVIALATGLRRSEVAGLRWQDIDMAARTIAISGATQRIKGQGVIRSDPKTDLSRRTLPIAEFVIDALRRRSASQEMERAFAGDRWKETGFVFTSRVGTPVEPRKLLATFQMLSARAEVPKTRFHDLRHFFATVHLEDGTSARTVQEQLGHTTVATTLAIYSHVAPQVHRLSAERMGDLLTGP